MAGYEVLLRIKHRGALIELSERHPSMRVFTWCNKSHEVMEVIVEEPKEYEEVLREVRKLATVIDESSDSGHVHLIVSTYYCNPHNSVQMNIDDLQILNISPEVLYGGWEYHRVIVFRHEDFSEMFDRLKSRSFIFEIIKKTEFRGSLASSLLATDTLFSTLTAKQMVALMRAYRHGYYQLPRVADVQEIASREKIKRTTFQKHLKKCENKIIDALVPYMQLYLTHPPEANRHNIKGASR